MDMTKLWHSETGGDVDMDNMQAQLGFVQTEQNTNKPESDCGSGRLGRQTSLGEY